MRIALYSRHVQLEEIPFLEKFFRLLREKKIDWILYESFYDQLVTHFPSLKRSDVFSTSDQLNPGVDYLFSLGGDGTLLDTVAFVKNYHIPIMGINIGRLGFLANIGRTELEPALDALLSGSYVADKRTLISVESNLPTFGENNFALNEFTIAKKDNSSMITIHTYINGEFLNSYWADGLIISTPTGSTGYSLSCGGPIILPNAGNFVITPIATHNLNVRPVVVPDNSVISFEIDGRADSFFCTLDSRSVTIDKSYKLAVRKTDFSITLARLNDNNFLNTLATKLFWGKDVRN